MLNNEDQLLIKQCESIEKSIINGIDWVQKNVGAEKQYITNYNLRKLRRSTLRFKEAIELRPAVAIFGQSQVGKSYLVSNLAKKPEDEILEILVPGENRSVDFITEMNPPGKGKEATGLVSRFTIKNLFQPGLKPYVLKLFSQADIVKIIVNGYLSDITHYLNNDIDTAKLDAYLQSAATLKSPTVQAGFSVDDVFDVKDYLDHNFKDHFIVIALNNYSYWDKIAELIPYIDAGKRWILFQSLWGEQQFFTNFFISLSEGLKKVNFAGEVRCGIDALTSQDETIIDVERLREMFKPSQSKPDVNLQIGSGSVTISRSVLSAITAEVILPLPESTANHPQRKLLKEADVLDFPGARSRNKIPEDVFTNNNDIEKLEVFLRGKVAFLFDRYNINFAISSLLFCMDNSQPEVQDIPRLLYEWIKSNHGDSPQEREDREKMLALMIPNSNIERIIPLLVVLTKFNVELAGSPSEKIGEPKTHDGKWNARLSANFNEFMKKNVNDKWTEKWNNSDGSFKNVFLLRDPKFPNGVYEGIDPKTYKGAERISPDYIEKLRDMKTSFLQSNHVSRHFRNPSEAWVESTEPGKSGIDYIVRYLTPTCEPIIKREQLKNGIVLLRKEVCAELGKYYTSGDINQQLAIARKKAAVAFMNLLQMQQKNNTFGNLIDRLTITDSFSWKVFYDVMMQEIVETGTKKTEFDNESGLVISTNLKEMLSAFIDINDEDNKDSILHKLLTFFGLAEQAELKEVMDENGIDITELFEGKKVPELNKADIYAQKLISKWLEQVNLIKQTDILNKLGLSKKGAELLIEELQKNMDRVALKKQIANAVREFVASFEEHKNLDVEARIAACILNRFVTTLGWDSKDIPKNDKPVLKNAKHPIFSPTEIKAPDKNDLELNIQFPGQNFFNEWSEGLKASFTQNVYFENNVQDAEKALANSALGVVIKEICPDYAS